MGCMSRESGGGGGSDVMVACILTWTHNMLINDNFYPYPQDTTLYLRPNIQISYFGARWAYQFTRRAQRLKTKEIVRKKIMWKAKRNAINCRRRRCCRRLRFRVRLHRLRLITAQAASYDNRSLPRVVLFSFDERKLATHTCRNDVEIEMHFIMLCLALFSCESVSSLPLSLSRWTWFSSITRHIRYFLPHIVWGDNVCIRIRGGTCIAAVLPHIRDAVLGHFHLRIWLGQDLRHSFDVVLHLCASLRRCMPDDWLAWCGNGCRQMVWPLETRPDIRHLE